VPDVHANTHFDADAYGHAYAHAGTHFDAYGHAGTHFDAYAYANACHRPADTRHSYRSAMPPRLYSHAMLCGRRHVDADTNTYAYGHAYAHGYSCPNRHADSNPGCGRSYIPASDANSNTNGAPRRPNAGAAYANRAASASIHNECDVWR